MAASEEGFLQAIIADPENDTPRLIFADWLDEHEQPERAEFIRLQCRLACLDELDPERLRLADRERALEDLAGQRWQPQIPKSARYFDRPFRRGFVGLLARTIPDWLVHPDRWDHLTPVEGLECSDASQRARELADSPHLRRLSWLKLQLGDDGLAELARSPYLDRVESPILQNVVSLDLRATRTSTAGATALARSSHLRNLLHLNLTGNYIGGKGALALAGSPYLPNRLLLNILSGTTLTDAGRQALRQRWGDGVR